METSDKIEIFIVFPSSDFEIILAIEGFEIYQSASSSTFLTE